MRGITRREAVLGGAFACGLVACGGLTQAFAGEGAILRPPGGQDKGRFAAMCIRCDRCRSACPQNCISVAHVEDGFVNARTPRIDFRKGACDFCGKCIEACPTQALVAFDESREKIGLAVVDVRECLAYRSTGCKVCFEKCPYEAISLEGNNKPVVDAKRCNGCGLCEFLCPSASLGSYGGSTKRGINVEVCGGTAKGESI